MSTNFVQFEILKIKTANDSGQPVVRIGEEGAVHVEFIDIERVRRFVPQKFVAIGLEESCMMDGTSFVMEDGVGLLCQESFASVCERVSIAESNKQRRFNISTGV